MNEATIKSRHCNTARLFSIYGIHSNYYVIIRFFERKQEEIIKNSLMLFKDFDNDYFPFIHDFYC